MKTNLISICLTLTLLTLVGCGAKEKSVTLEVSTGFAMTSAGFTGGLVVSGKNSANQRFVKTVFGGSSINVVLPDGTWELSVVGWDGSAPSAGQAPFSGDAYCGKTTLNLGTNDLSANVSISKANCLGSDFSGGTFYDSGSNPMVINPLRIVTCGSFYDHSTTPPTKITSSNANTYVSTYCSAAAHPLDLRSRVKSIKIIPLNKELNTNFAASANSNPYCQPTSFAEPGIFQLSQQIPVYNLPFQIELYTDGLCQKTINTLLFPDGIAAGNSNFDSIFTHKGMEAALDSSKPNRLIIPDNQLGKGYSPLIALMPHMKCNGNFCGDNNLISADLFDFFVEINYLDGNPLQEIKIPAKTDVCNGFTFSSGTLDSNTTCLWDSTTNIATIEIAPKVDLSGCSSMLGDICRSPESVFTFTLAGGDTRKVYFKGAKDFNSKPVYPFSHFYEPIYTSTVETSCSPFSLTSNTVGTLSGLFTCDDNSSTAASIKVKADYVNGTFVTTDDPSASVTIVNYVENVTNYTKDFLILNPDQWQQKDILRKIVETLGSDKVNPTFFRHKNDEEEDEDHNENPNGEKYGSIRRIREMFSPDGPAALFTPDTSCANLTGTKSITMSEHGETNTYEVVISNTDGSTAYVTRPQGFCIASSPLAGAATCGSTGLNNGKYQKKMTIKKDGVLESVMLFDCGQKAGRYESLYQDNEDGQYWREKELFFWNTEDSTLARYERYSINMESSESTFTTGLKHKSYEIEKIYKKTEYTVEGEVLEYGIQKDTSINQYISYTRYNLDDNTGYVSYADYSFWLPYSTGNEFFPSSPSDKYYTLKSNHHASTHFCSAYQFPFSYATNCTSYPFVNTNSSVHPLALTFSGPSYAAELSMEHVKPANLKYVLSPGYFSISTW